MNNRVASLIDWMINAWELLGSGDTEEKQLREMVKLGFTREFAEKVWDRYWKVGAMTRFDFDNMDWYNFLLEIDSEEVKRVSKMNDMIFGKVNENTSSKVKKITEELNSLTNEELNYVIKSLREAPIVDKFEGKNLDELYNSIIDGVREFLDSRPENFTFKDTGNRWLINMENNELPIDITKLDTYQYIAVGSHTATSIEKAIELIKKHFNLE